jgi:hypothetical protein
MRWALAHRLWDCLSLAQCPMLGYWLLCQAGNRRRCDGSPEALGRLVLDRDREFNWVRAIDFTASTKPNLIKKIESRNQRISIERCSRCSISMVPGRRQSKPDAPWRCCGISTPSVARRLRKPATSVPLSSSMAFDITMIGFVTSSSLLHLMASGHFPNQLTQLSLEPGIMISIVQSVILH